MCEEKWIKFVVVERDEDGYYVASVPELPSCHTQAKTLDELMKRIKEAIEGKIIKVLGKIGFKVERQTWKPRCFEAFRWKDHGCASARVFF